MISDRASLEGRRHLSLLSSTSELRLERVEGTDRYQVVDAQDPTRKLEMDRGEVARLRQRADRIDVALTSRMMHDGAHQEATRRRGRLDSRLTFRPSLRRFIFVGGQQETILVCYHHDGRQVPAAVISGGIEAFNRLGVLDSQALRAHDRETQVCGMGLDEMPLFCRTTYSGADEVYIDLLPVNNIFRRDGQPYRVSVAVSGGEKVFVSFASEDTVANLRSRLDRTYLVLHQEGQTSTQRGWSLPDAQPERRAS